jgi:CheY-like chemotaxis protein
MTHRTYAEAHIVIFDHEPATIRSLGTALESAGYPMPQEIANPVQAARHLNAADTDLVVFDVCMPDVDSYALLGDLTERFSRDSFLPVLAVGPMIRPEIRERAFGAGAKDFLPKPIDTE